MRKSGTCPKCAGTKILGNVVLEESFDQGARGDTSLVVHADPNALVFKNPMRSVVRAWVCTACGYTEFYALQPQVLKAAANRASMR